MKNDPHEVAIYHLVETRVAIATEGISEGAGAYGFAQVVATAGPPVVTVYALDGETGRDALTAFIARQRELQS